MTAATRNIDAFVREELCEYAIYDNSRSLPSVVDGLKTSHRKIMHTVFEKLKEGSEMKVANLGNLASDLTHYKHGEDSIVSAVIGLAQDFPGTNNYPLLKKEGQFGTVVDNEASSPRYIFVQRTSLLDNMFDKNDRDIVEYLEYDGDKIEPMFFLPKLPLLAINGSVGIGVGYACTIYPRKVSDVVEFIEEFLSNQSISQPLPTKQLHPSFNGFKGTVTKGLKPRSYMMTGTFKRISSTLLEITDLPPNSKYQYEKYKEATLLPLILDRDSGVKEFDNETKENSWKILVRHTREFGEKSDEEIIKKLNMAKSITETISVWGYDGKLKVFDSIEEMVAYWVIERLTYISKRKENMLKEYSLRMRWLTDLSEMIRWWRDNPVILKMKKDQIVSTLSTFISTPEHINKFLSQDLLSLTDERRVKILAEIEEILNKITTLQLKTENQLLLEDVSQFK